MVGDDRSGLPGALGQTEDHPLRLVDPAIMVDQRAFQRGLVDRRLGGKRIGAVQHQWDPFVAGKHVAAAQRIEQHDAGTQAEIVQEAAGQRHHAGSSETWCGAIRRQTRARQATA